MAVRAYACSHKLRGPLKPLFVCVLSHPPACLICQERARRQVGGGVRREERGVDGRARANFAYLGLTLIAPHPQLRGQHLGIISKSSHEYPPIHSTKLCHYTVGSF